jgi:hypothetical protein
MCMAGQRGKGELRVGSRGLLALAPPEGHTFVGFGNVEKMKSRIGLGGGLLTAVELCQRGGYWVEK